MILSRELVQAVTGDADRWHGPLEAALRRWQITTPTRVAMFLAQCGHESGGYRLVVESLRYSADAILRTWPNRFSADDAKAMAHDEQRIAERAYGGRMGNGPEGSGDGYRYRGRGIIQLTGRDNYQRCGEALGLDLVGAPELLEQPSAAAQSAGWFWATRGCNELADADDFIGTTRKINGGTNGQASRDTWLVTVRAAIDRYPLGEQRTETPQQAAPTDAQPSQREDRRMTPLLAGILAPAVRILFDSFSPPTQGRVEQQVERHAEQPGVSQMLGSVLSTALLDFVKQKTGRTDDLEAVAVARQDPALMAQAAQVAEQSIAAKLKEVEPMLAKSIEFDHTKWGAEREGKDAASKRAIEEKKAGLWDMTRVLVWGTLIMLGTVSIGLLVAIVAQSFMAPSKIDPVLVAIAGPIWGGAVVAAFVAIIAYRFDGTKESSDQTKAMLRLVDKEAA